MNKLKCKIQIANTQRKLGTSARTYHIKSIFTLPHVKFIFTLPYVKSIFALAYVSPFLPYHMKVHFCLIKCPTPTKGLLYQIQQYYYQVWRHHAIKTNKQHQYTFSKTQEPADQLYHPLLRFYQIQWRTNKIYSYQFSKSTRFSNST